MKDDELTRRIADLNRTAAAARELHPMLAAGKLKQIAEESLEVLNELVRREIAREENNGR